VLKVDRLSLPGLPLLSFDLAAGECLAIEGPSGSGKTRILRAIADLDPSSGYVYLEGAERGEMAANIWRSRVRYVSAEPAWWADTARGHVTRQPDLRRFERMALSLGLTAATLDAPLTQVSTGERLRLGLARALADEPQVILLDEPTSALDAQATALTEELIRFQILARRSLVLVSHDAGQIARLAQRSLQLGGQKASPQRSSPLATGQEALPAARATTTVVSEPAVPDQRLASVAKWLGRQP
jgi:ABC-type iron transport system FetAB ATPase subunit